MVTVGSNFEAIELLGTTRRWSKEDKDYIGVASTALIGSNNKSMSGTDQTDQAISTYRPFVHNMKWYWPLFLYYLEVSLYNSCLLYCIFEKDCPFLEHVQSIANSYLNLHQNDRRVFKTEEIMFRNSHVAKRVDPAVRFDGKNYLLEPDPINMGIVWQKVPNVGLNYMITVLQPFMDEVNSLSDKFTIIMH